MNKIIACIDASQLNTSVTHAAIWAAQSLQKPLMFLHTLEKQAQHGADDLTGALGLGARTQLLMELTELDAQRSKLALKLGKELLAQAVQQAQMAGIDAPESKQEHGDFVDSLKALEADARLLVVGRCGEQHADQGFKALGSHIESLLRQVHTPVLLTPPEFQVPSNFMLAYDGRATADQAVQRILTSGLLKGLACHLVSVKNKETELATKFAQTQAKLENAGFQVEAHLLEGPIFETLLAYQQQHQIDLLVMGAFAHSKLRRLFVGSNTLRMLESLQVPLIILK